ncbi:kallikrein-14-like [Rhynochetos jubatus]
MCPTSLIHGAPPPPSMGPTSPIHGATTSIYGAQLPRTLGLPPPSMGPTNPIHGPHLPWGTTHSAREASEGSVRCWEVNRLGTRRGGRGGAEELVEPVIRGLINDDSVDGIMMSRLQKRDDGANPATAMEVRATLAPGLWGGVKLLGTLVLVASTASAVAGETRVVGGMDCEPHSQPWQVAILDMYKLYCGGVLVARQWVVTAAHCTTPGITTIRLGKHNLYTREWGEVQKMVQKLVAHPNYDPTTKDNDIMMLKLLTPVTLTNRIQPIPVASCLPEPGTTCITSGWGATTSPEVSYPDVLQCVNVTIFSPAECHRLYPGSITENMLCAGSLQGGRDSCQGDSGGPLVCNGTLQGIVSWGMEKCGQPKRPGVYTKVCRYAQWIRKTMKDN